TTLFRSDLLAGLDLGRRGEQLLGDRGNRLLDPPLEGDGVGAGGDVAQTLADECLSENGSGGRTVTRNVIGLLGNFLDEFRTDLLVRFLELDLLRDGHAIVGDRGGAPLLFEHYVAALGAEGDLNGVGELVEPAF